MIKKTVTSILAFIVSMVVMFSSMTIVFANTTVTGNFKDQNGVTFTWTLDTTTGSLALNGTGAMSLGADPTLWVVNSTDYKTQIKSVEIGSGITQLGRQLFWGCTALESVTIPGTVEATQWGVFYLCTGLKTVNIESGLKTLADRTFDGCSTLTNVALSDTLETIGLNVFRGCAIAELTLPESLTTFYNTSFGDASNIAFTVYKGSAAAVLLKTHYPNANVTTIENTDSVSVVSTGNFDDEGYGLTWTLYKSGEFVVSRTKDETGAYMGTGVMPTGYFNNPETRPWVEHLSDIKSAVFEEGVLEVSARCLEEATNLISVDIADTVTKIGVYAFNACPALTNLKLSKNLTEIPGGMINNNNAITSLAIPFITKVDASSFRKVGSQLVLTIYKNSPAYEWATGEGSSTGKTPNVEEKNYGLSYTVIDLDDSGVDGSTTWVWDYETKTITIDGTGPMTSWHTNSNLSTDAYRYENRGWHSYMDTVEKVVIGAGVTRVGDYAFMNCKKLVDVEFAENSSLLSIGLYAFSNTALTEVVIPDSVDTIKSWAFRATSVEDTTTHTLTKITIPDNVSKIQDNALARQSNVTIYCNVGTEAADYARRSGVDYRLLDAEYYIEGYNKEEKIANILNSTESEKQATVIFANYVDGRLTSVDVNPSVELAVGSTPVPAGSDFVQTDVGEVRVFVWDSIENLQPLAKAYTTGAKVWMLGDSIMADWNDGRYPQEGWGEAFKDVVTDNVTVCNEAISGFTAENFYENVWSTNNYDNTKAPILNELSEGDYVIVAFLHNDYCMTADSTKPNYKDKEYINTYKSYMEKFVDDCEAKGAQIILVVPPNKGVTYNFHSALVDGVDVGDYSAVIPSIADAKGVPCINIHKWTMGEIAKDQTFMDTIYLTKNYIDSLVASGDLTLEQKANHYNSGIKNYGYDTTHLSVLGCRNIARFVADTIKTENIGLKDFLK